MNTREIVDKASEQSASLASEREMRGGKHGNDHRIPSEISATLFNLKQAKDFTVRQLEATEARLKDLRSHILEMDQVSADLRAEWEISQGFTEA